MELYNDLLPDPLPTEPMALAAAARADLVCRRPDRVQSRMRSAARMSETFYGLLANAALGLQAPPKRPDASVGGAIGGWIGLLGLHHKTRHPVFPLVLGIALAVQILIGVAVGW